MTTQRDRQDGKMWKLLRHAFKLGAEGQRVVYSTDRNVETLEAVQRARVVAAEPQYSELVERVYLGNGSQRVRFVSGGEILFLTAGVHTGRGLVNIDTHIVDGIKTSPAVLATRTITIRNVPDQAE